MDDLQLSLAWRQQFRRRLLAWFKRHARDLPWRRSRDPYLVWVSEIMLQQTQVATVVPYFERFVAEFPDIQSLADASEQAVLRRWEGLGYYRRARQLHRAARAIVDDHGGVFPRDPAAVRRLPGIGRYTAGAILSIAFDLPQPIVEANTIRLYCRLLAWPGDPRNAQGQRLLWTMAESLLPRKGSGALNQALMELGATLCTPRDPQCDRCPVAELCPTRAHGLHASIPRAAVKPTIEAVREAAVVVRRGQTVLLLRRQEGERWAGLWDFPRFAIAAEETAAATREIRDKLAASTGVRVGPLELLTTLKHGVTRFRITLDCFQAQHRSGSPVGGHASESRWVAVDGLESYPLSTTGRKVGRLLVARPPEGLTTNRSARGTAPRSVRPCAQD
jgi:A/G-specific adenine glycosylase